MNNLVHKHSKHKCSIHKDKNHTKSKYASRKDKHKKSLKQQY